MKKITLIGGDNRLKILKKELEKEGYLIDTLGLYPEDLGDINSSNIIILPVPTTKDGENVFCPLTDRKIPLEQIKNKVTKDQLILCCNYLFQNTNCIDYGSLDSYALLNAVPTAEGAIKIAMENTAYTLWKSKVLVIGYGRVGKILSHRLAGLGCDLTVSARKSSDFAMIDALGLDFIHTENVSKTAKDFKIIFNTVDIKVIDDNTLKDLSHTLLIDLSTKGGFDLDLANRLGINAIKAPGLPSKVAPKTAAQILKNTISHIINSYN